MGNMGGFFPQIQRLLLSFLLSFQRIRTVMALSRRERRPSFRPAELLGGTSTRRRMDRETRRQRWRAVRRNPARGGDAAVDCLESAGLWEPPPAALSNGNLAAVRHRPLLVRTPRGRGPQFGCAAERSCEGVAGIRGPGTRAGAEAQAAGAELGGELRRKRPWREGLAEGRQDYPEPRAGETRPAGAVGRPCSLGSQARPSPARRS